MVRNADFSSKIHQENYYLFMTNSPIVAEIKTSRNVNFLSYEHLQDDSRKPLTNYL